MPRGSCGATHTSIRLLANRFIYYTRVESLVIAKRCSFEKRKNTKDFETREQ